MTGKPHKRLASRLHFAIVRLARRLKRADAKLGLPAAQLSVLSTLVNRGAMTPSELAAAEGVRPPTMTRAIQSLEAGGYVLRRYDEEDQRVSVLVHTTRGWSALEEAAQNRAEELARELGSMSREELETLEAAAELLERLATRERVGAEPQPRTSLR